MIRVSIFSAIAVLILFFASCDKTHVWDRKDYDGAKLTISDIKVYRSEKCGCCKGWIDHLKKHGFKVEDIVSEDMNAVKQKLGVPENLASCHTAVIDGYVIEGHVPAQDIIRMLAKKPAIHGLTVPEMPVGTPGMESMDNNQKDAFNVIAFDKQGKYSVFRRYEEY